MSGFVEILLARNFADVRGANLSGIVPLTENLINSALNEEVAGRGRPVQQIEVRVLRGNRVQVGLRVSIGPFAKWFRPELIVHTHRSEEQSPVIVFTVAAVHYSAVSRLLEWLPGGMIPTGVQIKGDQIAVHVRSLPVSAEFRELFQHLSRLEITTLPGTLFVDFEWKVE